MVGGEWLTADEHSWGDLSFSRSYGPGGGGCKELSFRMTTSFLARNPRIASNASALLFYGGRRIWAGDLQDPEWQAGEVSVSATGLFRRAEGYATLDGEDETSDATDVPTLAVDAAINRGLGWSLTSSVPNTPYTPGVTQTINRLNTLLEAHAVKAGKRWTVDQFGVLQFVSDPTSPTTAASYETIPGAVTLGIARESYASHVILRYILSAPGDPSDGDYRNAAYPSLDDPPNEYEQRYGHVEVTIDATDQGPTTALVATQKAQAIYEASYQRPGWTNGFELGPIDLLTAGGMTTDPVQVAAEAPGKLLRLHGVPDEVKFTPYTDVVVAEAGWSADSNTVRLIPLGMVARSATDVWQELIEKANGTYRTTVSS